MGLIVKVMPGVFDAWLRAYGQEQRETRYPVQGGEACLGPIERQPQQPGVPLRWMVGGLVWGTDGRGYPLLEPLAVDVTPIGRGDRLDVRFSCRCPEAQAYLVNLIVALSDALPMLPASLWASELADHSLGELRLKASLADLGLAIAEFVAEYRAPDAVGLTVNERRAESAGRQRVWELALHLPEPLFPWPENHIASLALTLAGYRRPGRYPVNLRLTSERYAFPEVQAAAAAFLAACRATFWTAPASAPSVTARPVTDPAVTAPASPAAAKQPWDAIPDHLWDRPALRLWWDGLTCPEIGLRLSQAPKTIRNRLTQLRKTYGPAVVPLNGRRDRVGTLG